MVANVVAGIIQNAMWSWFSYEKYGKLGRAWAMWLGLVVAWELLDFPLSPQRRTRLPLLAWGCLDAHSLWHFGTVAPTMIFYNSIFLLKDAQDDMAGQRLKAFGQDVDNETKNNFIGQN
ncbi:hypothetical protein BDZ45DRAFT_606073 [Acephala macrosclerotiorum]|nr:hypothetical protein BDZ45DRAFT_606073 [Acephala macrosclerotiorum]